MIPLTHCLLVLLLFILILFSSILLYSHYLIGSLSNSNNQKIYVINSIEMMEKSIQKSLVNPWENQRLRNYRKELEGSIESTEETDVDLSEHVHVLSCSNSNLNNINSNNNSRGTISSGELVTYWRPPTISDIKYVSPYLKYGPKVKYVTFEPDIGGWNNIRMQMELVLVFAYATGRTLVLPPDQPMYLLNAGVGHEKAHNFADFFPFELIQRRVKVITMEDFMKIEAITGHLYRIEDSMTLYPPDNKTSFEGTNRDDRNRMWDYLRNVSTCPLWKCMKEFLIVPPAPSVNVSWFPDAMDYQTRREVFGAGRQGIYYDEFYQTRKVIHFISKPGLGYRLLEHFYTFIHFEDHEMDLIMKRFVRDYVHYIDVIFCKAAIIVESLLIEGKGSYTAFHIRRSLYRGEFQYKEVKISAEEMLENVGHLIPRDELIFIATDEKNKSFFNAFHTRFPMIRFLDDYMDVAELRAINPNFLGMIDQVVCTRGTLFIGTWFSTFSGYITRMRGYLGYMDTSSYYGDKKHRDRFQKAELPMFPFYMREWNISWYYIDKR